MITSLKVRLEHNNKQKSKLFQSAGVARWAYNWTLAKQEENYKNGCRFIKEGECCGAIKDRDKNASINLSRYKVS